MMLSDAASALGAGEHGELNPQPDKTPIAVPSASMSVRRAEHLV
jgi:hypothetical protein